MSIQFKGPGILQRVSEPDHHLECGGRGGGARIRVHPEDFDVHESVVNGQDGLPEIHRNHAVCSQLLRRLARG